MPNTVPEKGQAIVLVAAFNRGHEVLMLERPEGVHCGGRWSFPGGKVEAGELPQAAAERELREETCLAGERWQDLGSVSHAYADRLLHLRLFACECSDLSSLHCESPHAWYVRQLLPGLPMPEANTRLLPLLAGTVMDAWLMDDVG